VRRAVAHAAGCCDYSYHRPGRRRIPRIVTPALHRPLVTVAVVVDTSGSMGQSELEAALAEIKGVIRAAGIGPRGLLVLACDAAVGATTRIRRTSEVQLVGGGGTDMRVGITAAEAVRPAPDVVVSSPTLARPGRTNRHALGWWWPSSATSLQASRRLAGQLPCWCQGRERDLRSPHAD
jgi:predicted metal-dependent peptidase